MWPSLRRLVALVTLLLFCVSCATLRPQFESPQVDVVSVRLLPREGGQQQFVVDLQVTNPNSSPLPIVGIAYNLYVDEFKVANGVAADIPKINAYATGRVELPVTASLVNTLRLVTKLVTSNTESLSYRLEAKLDTGNPFWPSLKVNESGAIPLMAH